MPCQDEEGNLNFPSEVGGAEGLWCSELLPQVGRAGVGRRTKSQRERIFHAGVLGEKVGIGWEEQAGSLTKAGQNDRAGASQIEKGCMSALKSLNNFLAHV